ncbi:MAG: membrane protein insertion efficiency factor YidD [Defluviitaleaceae bacterium]|nr:membrane protein insertion efficiency factor YidD [Defluviitaleaceae bacterium]
MKRFILGLLGFYRRWVSPLFGPKCRFYPSCSLYMIEAVTRYGAAKGVWMGTKRLVRCHPFNKGGYDPVP